MHLFIISLITIVRFLNERNLETCIYVCMRYKQLILDFTNFMVFFIIIEKIIRHFGGAPFYYYSHKLKSRKSRSRKSRNIRGDMTSSRRNVQSRVYCLVNMLCVCRTRILRLLPVVIINIGDTDTR